MARKGQHDHDEIADHEERIATLEGDYTSIAMHSLFARRVMALEAETHTHPERPDPEPSPPPVETVPMTVTRERVHLTGGDELLRHEVLGHAVTARGNVMVEDCIIRPAVTEADTSDRLTGIQAHHATLSVHRTIIDGPTSGIRTTDGAAWHLDQVIVRNPRGAAPPRGQAVQAEHSGFGVIRGLVAIAEPDAHARQAVVEDWISLYGTSTGVVFQPVPGRAPDDWDVLLYGGESSSGSGIMSDTGTAGSEAEDRVIEFAPGVRALLLETGQYGIGVNAGTLWFRAGCEVLIVNGRLADPDLGGLYAWERDDGAQVKVEIEEGADVRIFASRKRADGSTYATPIWISNRAEQVGEFTERGQVERVDPQTFQIPRWAMDLQTRLGYEARADSVLATGAIPWEPQVATVPTRNP